MEKFAFSSLRSLPLLLVTEFCHDEVNHYQRSANWYRVTQVFAWDAEALSLQCRIPQALT